MKLTQKDREWLNQKYGSLLEWRESLNLTDDESDRIHMALSKLLITHICFDEEDFEWADGLVNKALESCPEE